MKKVLLLGGTGTMGTYLVPFLLDSGYKVDVVTIDGSFSDGGDLKYYVFDAYDDRALAEILKNRYDAIVDFLYYSTESFKKRYETLLQNTGQYIFLSSYRVYADSETRITEDSPRLIETVNDEEFLASDEYAMAKCKMENILTASAHKNWTIVRPIIVYGKRRQPLVIYDSDVVIYRAIRKKKILLPKEAMDKKTCMIWAGDVAKAIGGLLFNPKAYGEIYTIGSSETVTWYDVYKYYEELIGLDGVFLDTEEYINAITDENDRKRVIWWLKYDRFYNRSVDNSKLLTDTGLKQSEFMSIKDGLRLEIQNYDLTKKADYINSVNLLNERMDNYLKTKRAGNDKWQG